MIYRDEIKQHLKKLKQIKKDLKRDPIGTPLRKRDRIDVKHTNETRTNGHSVQNGNNGRSRSKSRRKNLGSETDRS